jgi:hypothetical protein
MVTWQITVDCRDATQTVEFWGPALGYEKRPPPEGFDSWNAVDARVAELVAAGATIRNVGDQSPEADHYRVVMLDPEGNEFCVA